MRTWRGICGELSARFCGRNSDSIARLGAADKAHLYELESVLGALRHLPVASAADPEGRPERARELEVIKRRLAVLFEASAEAEPRRKAALPALRQSPAASLVTLGRFS